MNKRKCMYCSTPIFESMGYVLPRDALILLEGTWDFATMGYPRELCPSYICMDKWNKELKEENSAMKQMKTNDQGELIDTAKIEMALIGPIWSPLMRIRIFMDHKQEDHMTIWYINWLSKIIGTYTPPGWFLKLIGQIK